MDEPTTRELYLELLTKVVANTIYRDAPVPSGWVPEAVFDQQLRENGVDWPSQAHTMVGLKRLRNVRECLERVLADDVAGDFVETGVWRGGVCVLARGVLKAHGVTDRRVWLADSFRGLPDPGDDGHRLDREMGLHRFNDVLGVPVEEVRANFERYDLLDDQVRFLPGWFSETLPAAPIERVAVLRLDGDLHSSTTDALRALYPRVSVGGFVIVDDYSLPACRAALEEFRAAARIDEPLVPIDDYSVFWRRAR
ncbi:TylF/MycF family methyltransferase [Saccharopolyspora rosea]|uniref:TylF/MycF family methyltransferase n=1 Tax=Saccharopolyspora rosea TaxID=524884 RepID=A0ABW3FXS4_9PSEU|nr:TylF/MycF family methyltransferase [Saccharopolyspora rosea]